MLRGLSLPKKTYRRRRSLAHKSLQQEHGMAIPLLVIASPWADPV